MNQNKKEIYLGNGQTIEVEELKDVVNYLDLEKLEQLIKDNKDKVIYVGTTIDWYYTAQQIDLEKFKKIKKLEDNVLRSSCWDTFTVKIEDDDEEQEIDCTIQVPIYHSNLAYEKGFYDGLYKSEQWLDHVYRDVISKLKYKEIKKLQEELLPIIKQWKDAINKLK